MRRTAVVLLLCSATFLAYAQSACNKEPARELLPVRVGSKYGYIDRSGRMVIKPQFLSAGDFVEGRAMVTLSRTVDGDARMAYIDERGAVIGETGSFPPWADVFVFTEGLAPTCVGTEGRKCGYFDRNGALAIPRTFDDVLPFSEGRAGVRIGEKWGYIDKSGKTVIPIQFDLAESFSEGLALVQLGKKFGFIDPNGRFAVKPQFDDARRGFSEGLAAVNIGRSREVRYSNSESPLGKWGFVDHAGKFVIPPRTAYEVGDFRCGTTSLATERWRGVIDRKGEWVKFYGDPDVDYRDGLKRMQGDDGLWGYIDKDGKQVIDAQFTEARDFWGGLAQVWMKGVEAYVDTTGRFIWKFPSDNADVKAPDTFVRIRLETEVDIDVEVANTWTTPIIVPSCSDRNISLCEDFIRIEQLGENGWARVEPPPSSIPAGRFGPDHSKTIRIAPGHSEFANYRFRPTDFVFVKGKPFRIVVFVYDADEQDTAKPLSQREHRTIVSDPFELPKPEWCEPSQK